jgi:hypothetical protein
MAEENKDRQEETKIYLTSDSTLQTSEEHRHDASVDPRKDNTMEASADDLHETKADRLAGSDRAGTAERTDNSISPKND